MSGYPYLERVVVVPRNGYANRLQAWASAAIFAADVDVPLSLLWEPEPVAASAVTDLFDEPWVSRFTVTAEWFLERFGATHEDLPRYLTSDTGRQALYLAGHDRGEQAFIPDLEAALAALTSSTILVIIAGGQFHASGSGDFPRRRQVFYEALHWSGPIEDRYRDAVAGHRAFNGLHVRQTDRSLQAPTRKQVRHGLEALRATVPDPDLFVAADTPESKNQWMSEAAALGFEPWCLPSIDFDRSKAAAGIDAMVEWRVLAATRALVFPGASSFSTEAAVASGHWADAIPLTATPGRQRAREVRNLATAAITYPRRHGLLGKATADL